MRFDVLTLFPELFEPFLRVGVTRRAYESRQVDVRLWPLRDFAEDNYRRVDDRPYGGGPGMVMLAEPLERALAAVRADRRGGEGTGVGPASAAAVSDPAETSINAAIDASSGAAPVAAPASSAEPVVIHFSPTGRHLDQALVRELATGPGAILLCGRYEGIDQRVLDRHVTVELSLGDFVLSGGELPALAMLDAVARLQDGVLNDAASHQQDSFSDGLLDCPHFSRPEVLQTAEGEMPVPPVLMSGHHGQIARWRREQSLAITLRRRPELIEIARRDGKLSRQDEQFLSSLTADKRRL
ncbi:tRNA (guanosine(37)-N1)-methyltransferase TrmD [Roseateles amylovorans]|uniref:tRNA (guanine-N(1)-)-methyltransferase n=1 Tax=Roseateles amylovorans TaxID=2978473 RepID=A0ABY6B5I5_9BURK|nr:tRNA (guanosine(37)-N1)-methyltransferase TrmD [Roseateles amylovorans]UXH80440.1 tRNA (guanosine(37)-N1)-methyltransferase TrmD [Roseateles amylovorans]